MVARVPEDPIQDYLYHAKWTPEFEAGFELGYTQPDSVDARPPYSEPERAAQWLDGLRHGRDSARDRARMYLRKVLASEWDMPSVRTYRSDASGG